VWFILTGFWRDVGDDMLRFAMTDNAGSGQCMSIGKMEEGVGLEDVLRRRKEYLFTLTCWMHSGRKGEAGGSWLLR
jgi:hypothetical protein